MEKQNRLVNCALALLSIVAELRNTPNPPNQRVLHDRLLDQIKAFERCARSQELADREVLPARYFLCTLLDEAVLSTDWGHGGTWRENSLLMHFHDESWGGRKFFDALDQLLLEPGPNRQLLELAFLCLALGFQGQFRGVPDGHQRLLRERQRLYAAIRAARHGADESLAPQRAVGEQSCPKRQGRFLLWGVASVTAVSLVGLVAAVLWDLERQSIPLAATLARVGQSTAVSIRRSVPVEPVQRRLNAAQQESPSKESKEEPQATLRSLLADQVDEKRMKIVERPLGETVLIDGELFPPGRSELRPGFSDQIGLVAEALKALSGRVLVTGHTDSLPIRTRRFPSNLVLSQARAESVTRRLAEDLGAGDRVTAEGRGDTEPLLPDDPTDARNRRVEITLLRGDSPTPPSP